MQLLHVQIFLFFNQILECEAFQILPSVKFPLFPLLFLLFSEKKEGNLEKKMFDKNGPNCASHKQNTHSISLPKYGPQKVCIVVVVPSSTLNKILRLTADSHMDASTDAFSEALIVTICVAPTGS